MAAPVTIWQVWQHKPGVADQFFATQGEARAELKAATNGGRVMTTEGGELFADLRGPGANGKRTVLNTFHARPIQVTLTRAGVCEALRTVALASLRQ